MTRILWTVAIGLCALTLLGAALAWPSLPEMIPQKIDADGNTARWMKLPVDARIRSFAAIRGMFGAVALELSIVFGAVQYGMYETAQGRRAEWLLPALLVTSALLLPLVLGVFLPRFSEAVAHEEQRLKRRAAPDDRA
jgi:hypothetical protein